MDEGDTLHHCLFTNEFIRKKTRWFSLPKWTDSRDHREAVIDGSRKPDFVGYMRSNVGIAYPIGTESKNSLMLDLNNNIVNH